MTKNSFWVSLIGAASIVSGCSCLPHGSGEKTASSPALPSPVSAQVCDDHTRDCEITVTVDTSRSPCVAVVYPVITWVSVDHDVRLVWNLQARGFRFSKVKFKDEIPAYRELYASRITTPSKKQFHDLKVGPVRAEVYDYNTLNGSWDYAIEVSDGTTTCKVDPPVLNG